MPPIKLPFSVTNSVYTMATSDGTTAEITMYGDIVESRPYDYWNDCPMEGNFITLDEFMVDLKQIEHCKEITIRMHSYGGDAGVSNTIHNRLRELARDGATLVCIVDGVAMSGASLIMCACNTVKVNPSSLIMIHQAASFLFGSYNAAELAQAVDRLTAYDKMQIEIYKRKTGLSDTVIRHMMEETTYMTGREAVGKGFADEIMDDAEEIPIAASADGRYLFVRGHQMHLAPGTFAPDFIPTVKPEEQSPVETNTNQPDNTGNEGGNSMTTEELRAKYPEQVAEIETAARSAAGNPAATGAEAPAAAETQTPSAADERKRIQEIDAIAGLFDAATVNAAKYGDHPMTAQEMTYAAAQKAAKQGTKFLAALDADAQESGAQDVTAAGTNGEETGEAGSDAAMIAQAKADAAKYLKMKEGK